MCIHHQILDKFVLIYLRNSFRSPACIMATKVLVTEVPMLAPMIIGTAVLTSSTLKMRQCSVKWLCVYVCVCVITYIQKTPC